MVEEFASPPAGTYICVTAVHSSGATWLMKDFVTATGPMHTVDGPVLNGAFVLGSGFAFAPELWPGWTVTWEKTDPPKPPLPPQPPDRGIVQVVDTRGRIYRFMRISSNTYWDVDDTAGACSTWEQVCEIGTPELLVPVSRQMSAPEWVR